ncbi:MAG: exodeoxyribonuclease VII large subunit [Phascolarctobacterium sp.]
MATIYSVTEINKYIKGILDADYELKNVQVQGEISNFKRYGSGHCYFTLKDGGSSLNSGSSISGGSGLSSVRSSSGMGNSGLFRNGAGNYSSSRYGSINEGGSVLKCVMFRYKAEGLRFEPKNGDKVIAVGHIQVYERDGVYQLYTDLLLQQGTGDLMQQYEKLKAKLEAEGLFDEARKKSLPTNPARIGVVTSSSGAVIHDIIQVSRGRNPGIKIYLYPVLVQGKGAAQDIARGIKFFNEHQLADVLIVGRGGGSMEDLWAFNEEPVVRAVAASSIPIISSVGHETDFTLCDFAADKRAATPSHAANMATVDMGEYKKQVEALTQRLERGMHWQLEAGAEALQKQQQCRFFQDPQRLYASQEDKLARLQASYVLQDPRRIYRAEEERLQRLLAAQVLRNPRKLYELKEQSLAKAMSSWALQEPQRMFAEREQRLDMALAQLVNLMQQHKQQAEHRLALNQAKLEAISPYEVFKRGYSCVRDSKQKIVSSIEQVRWGDEITTSVKDGQIVSVVQEVERR